VPVLQHLLENALMLLLVAETRKTGPIKLILYE